MILFTKFIIAFVSLRFTQVILVKYFSTQELKRDDLNKMLSQFSSMTSDMYFKTLWF